MKEMELEILKKDPSTPLNFGKFLGRIFVNILRKNAKFGK